jgi:hypothetical protein
MKRLAFVLLLLAAPAWAAIPLAVDFDLEGPAASTINCVAQVNLTNAALTVVGSPPIPSQIDVVIVDTTPSITVGTVTIVGTGTDGAALTEALDCSAGAGTYPTTAYFATVTSFTPSEFATLGGGGDETIEAGYQAPELYVYPYTVSNGKENASGWTPVSIPVTTSGVSTTSLAAVTALTTPFSVVAAGDLLHFSYIPATGNAPQTFERLVVTRTDADNVVLDTAITIPAAGTTFSFRHATFSADPEGGWVSVTPYDSWTFSWVITQNTDTGGINYMLQCRLGAFGSVPVTLVGPTNVASGAAATTASYSRVVNAAWDQCRLGFIFGTNDDADATGAASEKISVSFSGR